MTTFLMRTGITVLAITLLATGCQSSSDDATKSHTATTTTENETETPSDTPQKDAKPTTPSLPTAPGYAVGEVPPVPLITVPDLSVLDASLSGFTHELTELVGDYPGLTIAPATCDTAGNVQSGAGNVLLYGDGSGVYSGPDGSSINYGDGSGTYTVNGVTVTTYGDGSGTYTSENLNISNYGDGSGVYDDGSLRVNVYGDGSGTLEQGGRSISNYGDGSGTSTDGPVTISNNGDGSGSYVSGSLTIQNYGEGKALVNGIEVDADPLPKVPVMGTFPPLDAIAPITSCGTTISLSDSTLFDFGKSELRPDSAQALDSLAQALATANAPDLQISGYTDSIGPTDFNQTLSEARAQAVAAALKTRSTTATIETAGYGKDRPVAPNSNPDGSDNPAGRQLNRRVEIFVPSF